MQCCGYNIFYVYKYTSYNTIKFYYVAHNISTSPIVKYLTWSHIYHESSIIIWIFSVKCFILILIIPLRQSQLGVVAHPKILTFQAVIVRGLQVQGQSGQHNDNLLNTKKSYNSMELGNMSSIGLVFANFSNLLLERYLNLHSYVRYLSASWSKLYTFSGSFRLCPMNYFRSVIHVLHPNYMYAIKWCLTKILPHHWQSYRRLGLVSMF